MSATASSAVLPLRSRRAVPPIARTRPAMRRPVSLDTGDLLRVDAGAGTLIIARSGSLWITDATSQDDVVLLGGDTHRIRGGGATLIEAHRPARLIIEVPHVARAPSRIELLFGNGRESRALSLPASGARAWREWLKHAIARVAHSLKSTRVDHDMLEGRPRLRRGGGARHDPADYTPEAMRDRLLRGLPYPYY